MTEPVIISYSELFKWDVCQRQYYYRFGLGLSPLEESNAMTTGTKGHKLLQSFYESLRKGVSKEESLAVIEHRAKKIMEEENKKVLGIPTKPDSALLYAWMLVDKFIRETNFTSEMELIENRFLFPASELDSDSDLAHVQIGFTPDVVFRRQGNYLDVEDSKFVQRAWSKSKIDRFQQAKLYQIFLERMGYNISRSTIRFFNVQTGKITPQHYTLSKAEEATLIHDFMEGVKDVVRYKALSLEKKKNARRTMNYPACQYCAFAFPCTLEAEGKDATKTLDNMFEKSNYSYAD